MEAFTKQSTELKKKTNNIDLHEDKLGQAKQREEDLRLTREGIACEVGGFDKTQLCRVGKKIKNLSIPTSRCAVMPQRPFRESLVLQVTFR